MDQSVSGKGSEARIGRRSPRRQYRVQLFRANGRADRGTNRHSDYRYSLEVRWEAAVSRRDTRESGQHLKTLAVKINLKYSCTSILCRARRIYRLQICAVGAPAAVILVFGPR